MSEVTVQHSRKAFFSPRGLATYLGISITTVYDLMTKGELPSYKFGGSRRIAAEDVDAFVAARKVTA